MISGLSLDTVLAAVVQIILPMAAAQILCRMIDRKTHFARRLLPDSAKRAVWLTIGIALAILLTGAAMFLLRAGIKVYFIVCGAVVGVISGIVLSSMGGGDTDQ